MGDQIQWLKDVVVPLLAAVIGVLSALYVGVFYPRRKERESAEARERYHIEAFRQATHLLAAQIQMKELSEELKSVLHDRTAKLIKALATLAPVIDLKLRGPELRGKTAVRDFHFLIILLDERIRRNIDKTTVLFAYGVGAVLSLFFDLRPAKKEAKKESSDIKILQQLLKPGQDVQWEPFRELLRLAVTTVLLEDTTAAILHSEDQG